MSYCCHPWSPHSLERLFSGRHHGSAVLGLQPCPIESEWRLVVLSSLAVLRTLTSNPPFPLVSFQDVGSLDEKMKSLDVNQDSELKFHEYWRLIGELAKEIQKERALEIRKK